MDESMPPSLPASHSGLRMSLGARLMNVFTGPGEVFADVVKGPPSLANWLVPALLLCLVGVVASLVVLSQDAILHQMKEKQELAIQKRLERLPKEQREQAMATFEKMFSPPVMKTLGAAGAVARGFGPLFLVAVVVWLVGTKVFKGAFAYMQAVEVCGLAAMISVLGSVISMLLVVVMANPLATPGPALLIHELDASNPLHLMLSALNVMTIWYIGVLGIGLAKLSGASVTKSALWLFGIWATISTGLILVSTAAQKLA